MTDIATLIHTLGAAGAPTEAIALAVETVAEAQRASVHERKRRQRAREAATGDVTGPAASASSPLMSPASPDPSTSLNPPTEHTPTVRGAREKPRVRSGRLRKGRPKRLRRDWQPEALPPDDHEMVAASREAVEAPPLAPPPSADERAGIALQQAELAKRLAAKSRR